MRKFVALIVLAIVLASASAFADEGGTHIGITANPTATAGSTSSSSATGTGVGIGKATANVGPIENATKAASTSSITDNSRTTVVGSFPETNAANVNAPQIPLNVQLLINQWNETSFDHVFCSFPSVITTANIRVAIEDRKEQSQTERGIKSYEEIRKKLLKERVLFFRYSRTSEVRPMKQLPPGMVEGVDFIKMTPLIFVAEDSNISKDWIGAAICDEAMALGGDVIIPTDEGAERLFKNKAALASFLASIAEVGIGAGSKMVSGVNFAPGLGFSVGENSVKVFPYLRVKVVKILNWNKFLQTPFCEAPAPPPAPRDCSKYDEIITNLKKSRKKCHDWCLNNMLLNIDIGDAYSDKAKCTGFLEYLKDAERAYARAEENYIRGVPNKQDPEVEEARYKLYYHWTYPKFVIDSEDAAWNLARKHGIRDIITDIE